MTALSKEQDIEASVAQLESQARDSFGFDSRFTLFLERVSQAKESLGKQAANIQALHGKLAKSPRGGETIARLLPLLTTLPALTNELAALLSRCPSESPFAASGVN